MEKKTTELIDKVLGEETGKTEGRVARETGKKFITGKDIINECERFEHIIASEGEEAFMERVRGVISNRGTRREDSEEQTEDSNSSESNTQA